MNNFLFFLLLLNSLSVKAQWGYEQFYSRKDLETIAKNAKSPLDRINGLGMLARNGASTDSVTQQIYAIASRAGDNKLMATAMRWDAELHSDTAIALKLLQFAAKNKLTEYQISAHLSLSGYYIHHSLDRSLYYAIKADSLFKNLSVDSLVRDSLKIEICQHLGHVYIHRGEGLKAAGYLVQLRDYAEKDKMDGSKIQALETLSDMYYEWDSTQARKTVPWVMALYTYFNGTNQANKMLGITYTLGMLYWKLQDSTLSGYYFKETEHLEDSLQVHSGFINYWKFMAKLDLGLITPQQAVNLMENDSSDSRFLSPQQLAQLKTIVYLKANNPDSAYVYLLQLKKLKSEYYDPELEQYYIQKKDYKAAIVLLHKYPGNLSIYEQLVDCYKHLGNYKLAFEYKIKYDEQKDSLDHLNSAQNVAYMEMDKDMRIQGERFKEEQRLQSEQNKRIAFKNKTRLYSSLAGLAVLLFVAGLLWRNNSRKQKDKLKIEQAYRELKSTQSQLIQSEKMASLGELTAGIAHEIQNPLNFVNNFSEVSSELVDEWKVELAKGNGHDAVLIAEDVKQNLEKIIYHGKRADAIVKGMLEHSRTSSGQKELTDINALADEYLRLAYHGMRARDKSFNAKFETDFDDGVGKINAVPQDIGRVLLNLVNNAFYAVSEKARENIPDYEPTVSVVTKRLADKIELGVIDNGNGIPKIVVDKIFYPFFTTKPTGQGTGLGLSLAYDIIKAHGGDIKVNSEEGKGAAFVIQLPSNKES